MSFDICIWDRCNNACLMCTNPDRPWPAWDGSLFYDFDSLIKRINVQKNKIKKANSLYLTGGEPTLHPRFLDILEYISANFPKQKIKLLTNGRRFAYGDFSKKFLKISNNIEIELSLYGPDSQTHDQVTRARGSFKQSLKGLENLLKYRKNGQIIGIRTVLTRISYKKTKETLGLIKKKFPEVDRVIVIFHEIEAQALKNLSLIKVEYQEVAPHIRQAAGLVKEFKEIRFYHFPLCVIDKNLWPYVWKTLPAKEVAFVKNCQRCGLKKSCVGIHKGYLKKVGDGEFLPVKKTKNIIFSNDKYQPILKVI